MKSNFVNKFFYGASKIIPLLDLSKLNKLILELKKLKSRQGRLFILGVGGSAGNASHAVNDFRKICELQAYCPTDNVSELSARTNDEGFQYIFSEWLRVSMLSSKDAILIFSVGGGNLKKNVSVNIINAINFAKKKQTKIFSIVGRDDGYAYKKSNISIQIPIYEEKLVTPYSEAFQALLWHCMVSDPRLQKNKTKW
jgi:D-sedoheptulose 7-phosphate isomerase